MKQPEIGLVPENWALVSASDYCFQVTDGTHDSPKRQEAGRYLITSRHITSGKINLSTAYKIAETDFHEINKRSGVTQWDVLLSMIGTVGAVVLVRDKNVDFAIKNIGLFKSKGEVEAKWLYYYLQSPPARQYIKNHSSGSTQQYLTLDLLRKFPIVSPPNKDKTVVLNVLTSLDDKIELNRKMNRTLEEIGKALFKRWFVDFEFPDQDGKPYKSSGGKMVDSELGEIPAGWEVGTLSDEFKILMGQSPPGNTYNENGKGLPFYQGRADFGERYPNRRMYCSAPTRVANPKDTLLSVRAPVGDINQANEECCIGRGVAAISKGIFHSYTFCKILSLKQDFRAYDQEGTVFGSITKDDLARIQIVIPSTDFVQEFERLVAGINEQVYKNSTQITTLSHVQDSLLPRLMSGKLRVWR